MGTADNIKGKQQRDNTPSHQSVTTGSFDPHLLSSALLSSIHFPVPPPHPPLYPQGTLTTHLLTGNICTAAICRHTPNLYPAPCLCRNTHALTPGSRGTPDTGEQQETPVAFVAYQETAFILRQMQNCQHANAMEP